MSMEFGDDNEIRGGGGALMGLLAGSALNKDRDDGRSMTWFAMVIVLIVFFIAIIFLALAFKDNRHDRKDYGGTDIAAMLTPLIAAKSIDGNGYKNCEIDKIYEKLEHNEDRARQTQTQQEIGSIKSELGAVALMIQKTASDNEKDNLKEFGEIKMQLGMQSQALQQLLTKTNNSDIINGVIMQLTGRPCIG